MLSKKYWIKYLEIPKNRFIFMMPQTIIWTITLINLWLKVIFGIRTLPFIGLIHTISALIILISYVLILYVDTQRDVK